MLRFHYRDQNEIILLHYLLSSWRFKLLWWHLLLAHCINHPPGEWNALVGGLLFILFWVVIILGLQCSINFCCTAKWPSYIHILFSSLSSIFFHHKWSDIVPWAIQRDFIAYPLQMQLFVSTNPKVPPPPSWHPPVCSPHPWVCFFSIDRFISALY